MHDNNIIILGYDARRLYNDFTQSPKRGAKLKQIRKSSSTAMLNLSFMPNKMDSRPTRWCPWPVLLQIIVCSMNCGIGNWIIAQSPKWRLEFVEYKYTAVLYAAFRVHYLDWCWVAICSSFWTDSLRVCVCKESRFLYVKVYPWLP